MVTEQFERKDIRKPSLGEPVVVDALVRQFATRVIDTWTAFLVGEPGFEVPLANIGKDARDMAAIFLGRNDSYDRTPWNADNRLGVYLRSLLPEESQDYGDPGSALFMWFAYQVAKACEVAESDQNAEEAYRRLEPVIQDVIAWLLHVRH
ncbi:hypothetical protein C7410_11936 [Paraburkholderia silvatlantica]|uniref:Uncharacterized protein n=1 Tax=Paraburkholderia silvatlantica TaxID=321895 RepID=A0A2V4U7Z5_9BURK|nr:hypothetical protein [Paraburkholderia silvatlantica]PYE19594.1 hypothetical protein C7410_11936 [Paraburkholderia silvatlantica]